MVYLSEQGEYVMETKDPSSTTEKQLEPLEFSEPIDRWESTSHYTNSKGQEFELRVCGANPEQVDEYLKEVRIYLEVLPGSEEPSEEEKSPEEGDKEYQSFVEEEFQKVELHPELDLQIDMEILNTQGVELPYELKAEIDPSIAGGVTHCYVTKVNAKSIKINLSASQNGVSGFLSGAGVSKRDQADVLPPDPPKQKARFIGTAGNPSRFFFAVTGLRATNKYSVGSSVKLAK